MNDDDEPELSHWHSPHYILDANKLAVPVSLQEWAEWIEGDVDRRRVALESVGPFEISTVFLGLDHNFGRGLPHLFETMIFNKDGDDVWCERCGTWQEAIDMHERGVAWAIAALAEVDR